MKIYNLIDEGKLDVCVVVDVSQLSLISDIHKLDLQLTYSMESLISASSVSAIPNHDGYFSMHIYRAMTVIGVNTLTPSPAHLIDTADRVGVVPSDENVVIGINDLSINYERKPSEYRDKKPVQVVYGTSKDIDASGTIMTVFNFKSLNHSLACFRFPSYNGMLPMVKLISCLEEINRISYTVTNQLSLIELTKLRYT